MPSPSSAVSGDPCRLRVCAGCELRIAFKGVAFLGLILIDINYYQIIFKGLMIKGLIIIAIMIIKGLGGG